MEIKKDDLIERCKECNGTGYFKESSGSQGGIGVKWTREGPCSACGGRGGTLTDAGVAIAEVVRYVNRHE